MKRNHNIAFFSKSYELLKQIFHRNPETRDENILWGLQMRALVFHTARNLQRIGFYLLGLDIWESNECLKKIDSWQDELPEECQKYDYKLLKGTIPVM